MLLTIDVGNTNVVFALFRGKTLQHVWRCKTDPGKTADEYRAWLYQLFSETGISFSDISCSIVSSVVPDINFNLRELSRKTFGCEPLFVSSALFSGHLSIKTSKPEEVGADRLVNSLAVLRHYRTPAVIIDFGTATTFDVVDSSGAYLGGVIAPGVNLSMAALHQAAAKLPKISIKKPQHVIGHDTVSAMESGVYWGYVGMIEGILTRLTDEMGVKPFIIATGGLAGLYADAVPAIETVDKELTLKGLLYIHEITQERTSTA
jgi:type III pantothenate kinase